MIIWSRRESAFWDNMNDIRILIFSFLFCLFLDREILDAASTEPKTGNVCTTAACEFDANIILHYMDPKASPCDDFNKFACGSFLKNTSIPNGRTRVDRYDIIYQKNREQLKVSLEEKTQTKEPKWITIAKNFYKGCMDTTGIKKNGIRTQLRHLREVGGWPVLDGNVWQEKKFEWKQATYTLLRLGYGVGYLFSISVIPDFANSKKRVLSIDQPYFSLDREDLVKGFNNPKVKDYYDHMIEIAFRFGANKTVAQEELKESLKFQIKLASICMSEADRSNETSLNNPMNVTELSNRYPTISWKEYFNSIYSTTKSSIIIDDKERIIVHAPSFFEKFGPLMNITNKRVQANYILWRAVQSNLMYLPEEISNIRKKLNLKLKLKPVPKTKLKMPLKKEAVSKGTGDSQERREDCLKEEYTTLLKISISALYVRKYFNPESKKRAEELALNIEKRYKRIIQEADWMDEKTRTNTLNRLATIKNYIAYPDEYDHDDILNEFYKTLEITPNDFLQASSNMTFFSVAYYFNELRTAINSSEWTIHDDSADVGPFFSIEGNGIEVPSGILQDDFFNKDGPQYVNYAAMGSFNMGHEITHLFDNLDAYMTPKTKQKYLVNADCITKQYGNYTAENGLKLNGAFTRTENINDNSGVKVSYLAYQDWAKQHGPEPILPGLAKYSISQLFWLSAAMTQCDKYTPEKLKEIVLTDVHSPSGFRIIGTFSNRPEFARDFHCPLGSKMNPVKKCSVW